MPTVDLTKDTFETTVVDNDVVLVDFWAEWCGPCRSFAPTYEKVSTDFPDIVFAKVDTEDQEELAQYFGIRSIPTLMVFRDQIGIYSQPGALPEAALRDLIDQAMALDMDEVRKEIAAQRDGDAVDHDHADHDHADHDHADHDHADHDRAAGS
jgi:thioredoxin 1